MNHRPRTQCRDGAGIEEFNVCDDETVKRMLAEQMEDNRDTCILPGFTLADLDSESLHAYRNMLASHRPEHPWTSMGDQDFLQEAVRECSFSPTLRYLL